MVAVGTAGYVGLNRVMTVTGFYHHVNQIQSVLASAKGHIDQYLLACALGEVEGEQKIVQAVHKDIDDALVSIREVKEGNADAGAKEKLASAEAELHQYRNALNEYARIEKEKRDVEDSVRKVVDPLIESMEKGVLFFEKMATAGKLLKAAAFGYMTRNSEETWKGAEAEIARANQEIEQWSEQVSGSDELRAKGEEIRKYYQEAKTKLEAHHEKVIQQSKTRARMDGHKKRIDEICGDLGRSSVEGLGRQTKSSVNLIFGFILTALVLGIGYAVISVRSIVGKLKGVIQGITEGASEVSSAAAQVSASSQSLAQGASEQAATIEETSSSLEEMSAMTKQNADHASEADGLMQASKQMVVSANSSMGDLTKSMERISDASDETGKIIKAIDEIAFQTNLLALNAAVEAARAGQAGAGFAVVADEVRNLALRAAEAARNTAGMIEETIKRVKDGRGLVDSTNETFKKVAESATTVSNLVAEIAAASREQAQGIEQLNKAVAEMDRVVQQTAAGAEESASASEEMNAQADHVKGFIQELNTLVKGGT
jgi:methyl-accepting chemotaxis protein